MIKKLFPLVFLIVGLAVGVSAGLALAPAKSDLDGAETDQSEAKKPKPDKPQKDDTAKAYEYFKLTKQFVVPVVADDEITALVTMTLSLEANPGIAETFYDMEPRLRDGFLQVLFDHANIGGFDGSFTTSDNLATLRRSLLEVARKDLGQDISRVLILSVNRQDT